MGTTTDRIICLRGGVIIPYSQLVQKGLAEIGKAMPSALQRPHVLIVTDDPGLSDFLGEGLVYAGFWTSVIASALQTLEVFRLRSFDAIVLDSDLGGIGSHELLRRLQARTDIPILLIAYVPGALDSAEQQSLGIDRVLYPPIELEDLGRELYALVGMWRAGHPDRPWADQAALQSA
jgi:DNA-binding response OmpR family regulator